MFAFPSRVKVNYKFALKKMPYNFRCAYVQYYFGVQIVVATPPPLGVETDVSLLKNMYINFPKVPRQDSTFLSSSPKAYNEVQDLMCLLGDKACTALLPVTLRIWLWSLVPKALSIKEGFLESN